MMRVLTAFGSMEMTDHFADLTRSSRDIRVVAAQSYEGLTELSRESYERIAVHCRMFSAVYPWDWMPELKALHPQAQVMIALCEQTYDSLYNEVIVRLAGDFNFTLIPLGLTEREIAGKFAEGLGGKPQEPDDSRQFESERPERPSEEAHSPEPGRVLRFDRRQARRNQAPLIAVMSAAPKDGATTVAVNLALQLAQTTQLRVGLLDLNLKSPEIRDDFNIPASAKNLFSLLPRLVSNGLAPAEMIEYCCACPGFSRLHVLPGSHRRDTAGDVTAAQVKHLLDAAKSAFDIVIADVHAFPDNAATVYAMKHADLRLLVAQPSYMSFKSAWLDWYECFWRHCGLRQGDFSLIANRVEAGSAVKASRMEAVSGAKLFGAISNVQGGVGIKAVNEGLPMLLGERGGGFQQEIAVISRRLLTHMGMETAKPHAHPKPKRGLLGKMAAIMLAN